MIRSLEVVESGRDLGKERKTECAPAEELSRDHCTNMAFRRHTTYIARIDRSRMYSMKML